ncbi:MAG: sigma factor-like helix-turn-helix DNA-binding protein [Candidatus Hydrogenedentota bacterium]
MARRNKGERYGLRIPPAVMERLTVQEGFWHESPREVAQGLRDGARKAELLAWVKRRMDTRLTVREAECIRLHYFQGWSFRAIHVRTGLGLATVHRAIKRGLTKLRQAAAEEGVSWQNGAGARW